MSLEIILPVVLYISLISFIVLRYRSDAVLEKKSKVSPTVAVIISGVIYGLITFFNIIQQRNNPMLAIVIFISTIIIIYSVVVNVSSSPLLENLTIGAQNEDSENEEQMYISNVEMNLREFYNNNILSKTLVTLLIYTVLIFGLWLSIWKNNCTLNDLLCNPNYIFAMIYLGFALLIFLDMLRNTRNLGFFEYKNYEKSDLIFNNNWIVYSLFYALYLSYVLIISQSIRNTFSGITMDKNFNFAGLITLILIIIQFTHYYRLQNAREKCDCDDARISVLNNNIKVFQFNCILLPILIVIISIISPKMAS